MYKQRKISCLVVHILRACLEPGLKPDLQEKPAWHRQQIDCSELKVIFSQNLQQAFYINSYHVTIKTPPPVSEASHKLNGDKTQKNDV